MSEATHATVATFGRDLRREDVQRQGLHEHIVPDVRSHPGFVSGTWMLDRDAGTSVVVITFASREAAESFQGVVRDNAANQAAVGIELVELRLLEVEASAEMVSDGRVVSYDRVIAAPAEQIFALIADPAAQPRWDGNDNLATAARGQRVQKVGDIFVTTLTRGSERHNHVVEFVEGRRIAWRPSEPGQPPPGHLWRWELEPLHDARTLVRHTYDWSRLTDPQRMARARATTAERLRASVDRLAELVTPITRPRAVAYVIRDRAVLVFVHRPTGHTERAGLQVPGGTIHDGEDPAAAVVREVREETGLAVQVVRPLGTITRDGRELHHFHVAPLGDVPEAWDHDERSDGEVPLWTFSLFWLPIPVARHALDHGMGDLLDRL